MTNHFVLLAVAHNYSHAGSSIAHGYRSYGNMIETFCINQGRFQLLNFPVNLAPSHTQSCPAHTGQPSTLFQIWSRPTSSPVTQAALLAKIVTDRPVEKGLCRSPLESSMRGLKEPKPHVFFGSVERARRVLAGASLARRVQMSILGRDAPPKWRGTALQLRSWRQSIIVRLGI
jgi:hypothetical protein